MSTWNTRGLRGSTLEDMINRTNEKYRDKGLARVFVLTPEAIFAVTGKNPVPYSPPRTQFLTAKGETADAPLIQTHRKT